MCILRYSSASFWFALWACFVVFSPVACESQSLDGSPTDMIRSFVKPLFEKYDTFNPKGKFATGALVSFVTTKRVVDTTVKTAKYACAAYIASEALHYSGVLEDLDIPIDSEKLVQRTKTQAFQFVDDCRRCVRTQLNPRKVKAAAETALKKDKMTTLGAATGLIAGLVW